MAVSSAVKSPGAAAEPLRVRRRKATATSAGRWRETVNAAFAPSQREIAAAEALVAAATGGAQRHAGRMVEDMHVAAARALLERAARGA